MQLGKFGPIRNVSGMYVMYYIVCFMFVSNCADIAPMSDGDGEFGTLFRKVIISSCPGKKLC